MNIDYGHLIENLGLAAGYSSIGIAALVVGYFMWEALTPRHKLGAAIHGADFTIDSASGTSTPGVPPSWNAGLLLASGWLGNALIAGWSIFNTEAGVAGALTYCVAFSLLGLLIQGIAFVILDLLTPGKLNEIICEPGFHPYSFAVVAANLGVAFVVIASITP